MFSGNINVLCGSSSRKIGVKTEYSYLDNAQKNVTKSEFYY